MAPGWHGPTLYAQACAYEPDVCVAAPSGQGQPFPGPIPVVLERPLHLPPLRPGQVCPTTAGVQVNSPVGIGTALGKGAVRPLIAMAGDLSHGVTDVAKSGGSLRFKTDWIVMPGYQGPVVIRAEAVGHRGVVRFSLDGPPNLGPLVIPSGPTANDIDSWRAAPGETWLTGSGCYAWQVDGLTFSNVIVFRTGHIYG